MKIGVDGMGGDFAPLNIVEGVVLAAQKSANTEFVIYGPENLIKKELNKYTVPQNIKIVHAPEVVGMGESVISLLRRRKKTSLHLGLEDLAKQDIDAFLSAGNTAAVVALSRKIVGTEEGIERGAILVVLPSLKGEFVLIDAGANVYAKAPDYRRNAIIGESFSRVILGKESPRIGLLNIGEEASKGHKTLKEVHRSLQEAPFNFVGNVESREIFFSRADVVLTDGFVGNIVLKLAEGLAELFVRYLKEALKKKITYKLGYMLSRGAFRELKDKLDYSEYGGGLLVGFKGNIVVAHGRSSGRAIENAILFAEKLPMTRFHQVWKEEVKKYRDWVEKGQRRNHGSNSEGTWGIAS